jgi:hypothetical protein
MQSPTSRVNLVWCAFIADDAAGEVRSCEDQATVQVCTKGPPEKLPKRFSPARALVSEGVSVDPLQKQVRHLQFTGIVVQVVPELEKEALEAAPGGRTSHELPEQLNFPNG